MGQYYKKNKIGTCESMYYMRLSTAQELAELGEKDDDGIKFSDYLSDNETKWRFPFPDEDKGIPSACKYNKSFMIPAGNVEVNHTAICLSNSIEGTYNVNIFLPCPYSQEFKDKEIKTSYGGAGEQMLNVIMEGIRTQEDGTRRVMTIFECARCQQMQRFPADDIVKIKARATEYYSVYKPLENNPNSGNRSLYEYAMKIIERIK